MDEDFCKSCWYLTGPEIQQKIEDRIEEFNKKIRDSAAKGLHSEENFGGVYESEIKHLQQMAEYIAVDRFIGEDLNDADRKVYDEIVDKMKI